MIDLLPDSHEPEGTLRILCQGKANPNSSDDQGHVAINDAVAKAWDNAWRFSCAFRVRIPSVKPLLQPKKATPLLPRFLGKRARFLQLAR